jgi:hypothetical protein
MTENTKRITPLLCGWYRFGSAENNKTRRNSKMNSKLIVRISLAAMLLIVMTIPAMAQSNDCEFYFNLSDGSHEITLAPDDEVVVYLDCFVPEKAGGHEIAVLFDPDVVQFVNVTENISVSDWMLWTFRGIYTATDPELSYMNFDAVDIFGVGEPNSTVRCGDIRFKAEGPGVTTLYLGLYPDDVPNIDHRTAIGDSMGDPFDWVYGAATFVITVEGSTYTVSGYSDPVADTVKITNLDKSGVVDERPADYIDPVTGFYNLTLNVSGEVEVGDVLRITACQGLDEYESNCNVTNHTVVNAPGEDINVNLTLNHYCLDLTGFPMYEAEEVGVPADHNKGCGPAVAKMWLDYMHNSTTQWNNTSFGDMPAKDQAELYDWGIGNNSNITHPYLDTQGMWYTVQYLDPIYSGYGYNFGKYSSTDQEYMMKEICRWISYAPGDQPGHPVHVPAAVPAYGNYENWMAVRGIHTSEDAYPLPPDLLVYGLWVNDPYPASLGGIGENSYKTADEWKTTYYLPLDVPGEETYNGKYVGILEPPGDDDGEITIVPAKPRFVDAITPVLADKTLMVYDVEQLALEKVVNNDESLKIVAAAIDGVSEELLPYDAGFAQAFAKTTAGSPMLVSSDNGNYYLVPFNVPVLERPPVKIMPVKIEKIKTSGLKNLERLEFVDGDVIIEPIPIEPINLERTLVVVIVDAGDGSFKEASWVADPVKYLPVSNVEALKIALGEINVTDGDGLSTLSSKPEIELVYRDASPYYPDWKVTISSDIYFVNQDGMVSL